MAIKHRNDVCHTGLSRHQPWASECPYVKNYKWRLNPVWLKMIYSCTQMATVGVKGLRQIGYLLLDRCSDITVTWWRCEQVDIVRNKSVKEEIDECVKKFQGEIYNLKRERDETHVTATRCQQQLQKVCQSVFHSFVLIISVRQHRSPKRTPKHT